MIGNDTPFLSRVQILLRVYSRENGRVENPRVYEIELNKIAMAIELSDVSIK